MLPHRAIALVLLGAALAAAAEPRIDRAEPQGLRRGSEATVKLAGARLGQTPEEIVFYESGIEATEIKAAGNNSLTAKLRLADDCPIGRHAIRVRTATGLSNLITLHVGTLEAVVEAEPNNELAEAQPIPFNRTVHGVVKPGDEDVFAVQVAEGQRLSIEVEGLRLGRTFFDPVVEVLDELGTLVAANDDQAAAHSDAFLTYLAPAAGTLRVRLRESAFRGEDKATYLLHVGDFPRPTAVFPPVVKRGGEAMVAWIGADVPEQKLPVPTDAGRTIDAYATDERGVAPSALPLWVSDQDPTLEAEPNDQRNQPTPLPCPGVAAGVIQKPGDLDYFRITATEKQTIDLHLHARKLRSVVDPVLRVYAVGGGQNSANDDDRGHPDSYLRFVAPKAGDYLVRVEDRLGRGGEAYTYVLEATTPKPVAEIGLDERRRYVATRIEVPRGGRTAGILTVTRRDFGEDLRLAFERLPPGVTAECFPLAADFNRVPVVFSAADDAELASSLSPVTVTPVDSEKGIVVESRFKQPTWLVRGRNNRAVWSHFADRAPVAVTERLPFTLSLEQPKAPICRSGSLNLKVTAQRDEGFDQSVAVKMLYHSPGVSSNGSRSIKKGESEAIIPVTANNKAKVGDWPITVVGETNLNGRVYVCTQFVTLRVTEAYFDIALPTTTAKPGESVELIAKLTPRTEFEGPATLELVGLPHGVKAEPIQIEAGAESAAFQLVLAKDAKIGRHRSVGCRARLSVEGEPVVYRQAYAELRIDPPEPPPERTANRPEAKRGTAK